MNTSDILNKSRHGNKLPPSDLVHLLELAPDSAETFNVMAEANRMSKELSDSKAEIHAQFALNLAPCPCQCLFCSFAKINGIFREETKLEPEEAVDNAKKGNCSHEPCTLGAAGGANLFWAEMGANLRDVQAHTEKGRGDTVEHCATLYRESGWDVWSGPSRYYTSA